MHLLKPFKKFQNFEIKQEIKNYKYHLCLTSSVSLKNHEINKITNIILKNDKK